MIKYTTESTQVMEFAITLRQQSGNQLAVRVAASPAGESREFSVRIPLERAAIEEALASIIYSAGDALIPNAQRRAYDPVVNLGQMLFAALTENTELSALYRRSLDLATANNQTLRWRFIAEDDAVDDLPWEFLFDSFTYDFVFLSSKMASARQKDGQIATKGSIASSGIAANVPELRLLVATAELGYFRADAELAFLQEIEARGQGMVQSKIVKNVTRASLLELLHNEQFDLFHFIGIGGWSDSKGRYNRTTVYDPAFPNQGLLVHKATGSESNYPTNVDFVSAAEVMAALNHKPDLRFVFLNAGFTDQVARQLAQRVPFTLGMRNLPTGPACLALASGLYEALLNRKPVDIAVTEGRRAINFRNHGSREWGLSVFYMQTGDGIQLAPLSTPAAAAGVANLSLEAVTLRAAGKQGLSAEQERLLQGLQAKLALQTINLEELRQQQSTYGDGVPDYITAQISEAEAEIAELQTQMQVLQG